MQFADEIGIAGVIERDAPADEQAPTNVVCAGYSLDVLPAQRLAQTRPGPEAPRCTVPAFPVAELGGWPDGVPVQMHGMEGSKRGVW